MMEHTICIPAIPLALRIIVLHALLTYRLVTIKDAPKNSVKDPIGFCSGSAYVVPDMFSGIHAIHRGILKSIYNFLFDI